MSPSPPSHPRYATPIPQSPSSPILTLKLSPPLQNLTLIGRSRAAWHTSFIIPELNLLLDAGLFISDKHRPKHIFLTHGHSDHTLVIPGYVKRDDPPDVVCPVEMGRMVDDYVLAKTMLNKGGLVQTSDADAERAGLLGGDEDEEDDVEDVLKEKKGKKGSDKSSKGFSTEVPHMPLREHRPPGEKAFLGTHYIHGVKPGDVHTLRRLPHISAMVFACDHNVPSVGYLFQRTTHRLSPEYTSLPPAELKSLRQSGTNITTPHTVPLFAFLGDGTASTLAASPSWLEAKIPLVITECSFLYERHRAQAVKTKHTIWADLEPVVRRWPDTTFVLTHFSLRYGDGEVRKFFSEMEDCPANVVVWADPESE